MTLGDPFWASYVRLPESSYCCELVGQPSLVIPETNHDQPANVVTNFSLPTRNKLHLRPSRNWFPHVSSNKNGVIGYGHHWSH